MFEGMKSFCRRSFTLFVRRRRKARKLCEELDDRPNGPPGHPPPQVRQGLPVGPLDAVRVHVDPVAGRDELPEEGRRGARATDVPLPVAHVHALDRGHFFREVVPKRHPPDPVSRVDAGYPHRLIEGVVRGEDSRRPAPEGFDHVGDEGAHVQDELGVISRGVG